MVQEILCNKYLQNIIYTRYFKHYVFIIRILILPSKIWGESARYTQQNMQLFTKKQTDCPIIFSITSA